MPTSACSNDDVWEFNSNGNYVRNEGPDRCSGSNIVTTGDWNFDELGLIFIMTDETGNRTEHGILEITEDKFVTGNTIYENGKSYFLEKTYIPTN